MPKTLKRGAPIELSNDIDDDNIKPESITNIQPLRDLAKNFDIDIEPYLDEYLKYTNHLDECNNEEEEATTAQSFANAALKIQNSVGIYNRKVDFLHQKTYEVFNDFIQTMIAHGKKKKKRSTSTTNGGDSAIETFMEFDSDMEFLLLDDVLPTDQSIGKNKINLREEVKDKQCRRNSIQGGSNSQGLNVTTMDGVNNDDTMTTPQDVTLLSLGGVMSATRMMDQNGTFMISRQSLDKASPTALSRMLMSNLQGGGTGAGIGGGDNVGEGNLRLLAGMCDVDASGALLMPGTRASVFVNGEAQQMNSEEDIQIFPGGLSPGPKDGDNDFGAANDDNAASFGGGGDDWGGDDNDGPRFELNDEHMEDPTAGGAGEEDDEVVAKSATNMIKPTVVTKPKPVQDPWAVLDKDEPSKDKVVPLRIGVTTRLPQDMDDGGRPSAAVTGSRTRTKKGSKKKKSVSSQSAAYDYQSRPFLADITFDEAMKDSDDENEDQLNNSDATLQAETNRHLKVLTNGGLIFGEEFAYVAKAHAKHRDAIRKQRRLQQQQDAIQEEEKEAAFDDDEHDEYGGFDFGCGADDDSYGQEQEGNVPLHQSNVDFSAIDDVFGGGGGGFDDNDFDDNFAYHSGDTFEDLCRAHLRKFNESAKAYAAETELTKRVGKWQNGLAPLLEEQEKRPEFDIHSYGKHILERVERKLTSVRKRTSTGDKKPSSSQAKNEVGFSTIIASKDCEDYEVCRLFLSTLMLCNCGNIAMHNGGNGEVVETMDSLNIELLDATFQPPMENFDLEDEVLYQNENGVA